jgi:hypothetical protein
VGPTALTSTCALSHLSILKDLTFEICVPSLRCRAAHRMHRKMPNYSVRQSWVAFRSGRHRRRYDTWSWKGRDVRSSSPILCSIVSIHRKTCAALPLTWIPRAAICACAVPRNRLDQILQRTLITRLLTFVQGRRHTVWKEERFGRKSKIGERQNVHQTRDAGERGSGWLVGALWLVIQVRIYP